MERGYDGTIFDCDGTLTDSMPLHFVAWRDTLARYGMSFPEPRFYAMGGMPTVKIVQILAEEHNVIVPVAQVAVEKEQAFLDQLSLLRPIDHTCNLAKKLKREGQKIAVASGSDRHSVSRQLQQIDMQDCFEVIVAAEDTQRHKPAPDAFLLAARRLGVQPTACCVWEDSDLGIQAAQAAGMDWFDIREIHQPRRIDESTTG